MRLLLLLQSSIQSSADGSGAAVKAIIDVSWFDLSLALGLILIAVGISSWQRLGLARDFIIGAIRTIVQLLLVGYVLVYIFAFGRWYITVAALLLMTVVATFAAVGRQKVTRKKRVGGGRDLGRRRLVRRLYVERCGTVHGTRSGSLYRRVGPIA